MSAGRFEVDGHVFFNKKDYDAALRDKKKIEEIKATYDLENAEDIRQVYALLAGGAPNDEFDGESREISARIHAEQSVQEIANTIAEVFNAAFDGHDNPTVFLSIAEQIKKELTF